MSKFTATTNSEFLRNRKGKPINVRLGDKHVSKQPRRRVPGATIRCNELDRFFTDRYGGMFLPDDDAGRDDVLIMLHHIAYRQAADRLWLMEDWLNRRAPWLIGDERKAFIAKVFRKSIRYTADVLAAKLGLTYARRERLGINSIGSIDVNAEERKAIRAAKSRQRKAATRRAAGSQPRSEYEAQSNRKQALAEGVSLATWYRRRKAAGQEAPLAPEPPKTHYAVAAPVSPFQNDGLTVTSS
jgi:hypothetical protein